MVRIIFVSTFLFLSFGQLQAQDLDKISLEQAKKSFPVFYDLLRLENDAHFPEAIEKNMQWCEKAFAERQFSSQRLKTSGIPLLLAERKVPNAAKTVLIYLQIDGQPVDPDKWDQPSPWQPVLKEKNAVGKWTIIPDESLQKDPINPDWRIFARSTADAKGPAMAYLAALDAIAGLNTRPNYNMKVILDFEEELGSPRLPDAVIQYKKELAADMLIIFDGPRHVSNQPTLSFGARGICEITLTTFGPRTPMHSGNYGNYAPNPVFGMANLLSTMKDSAGRVLIKGFYDGIVISEKEKKLLSEVPDKEEEIRKFLGIAVPEKVGANFQEAIQYPTLNVRGLQALYVGEKARTLIPDKAIAEIDIRLVPSSDANKLIGLVKKHVESQGYHLVDKEPTESERMTYSKLAAFHSTISYGAFQTSFDSETGVWLQKAMKRAFGKDPIRIRMTGGSIPISPFVVTLGIPAVSVPTVNADNNQHAENENIRVGNYIDAIKTFMAIMLEKL